MPKTKTIQQLSDPEQLALQQLLTRAQRGELKAFQEVKKQLDEIPEIWQTYADLDDQAILAWITLIAGPDLLLKESLARKVQEVREEFGGDDLPLIEQFIVNQIISCWLQARHVDTMVAQNPTLLESTTFSNRQTSAHHRLAKSIQALATLRKQVKPTHSPVQIATRLGKGQPAFKRQTKASNGVAVLN